MKEEEDTEKKLVSRLKDVIKSGNLQAASEALVLLEEKDEIDLDELRKEVEEK